METTAPWRRREFETDADNRIADEADNLIDETDFPFTIAGVNTDTQAPSVTILNATNEDITDDNGAAYPVRGTCDEPGDLVISLNGTALPCSVHHLCGQLVVCDCLSSSIHPRDPWRSPPLLQMLSVTRGVPRIV